MYMIAITLMKDDQAMYINNFKCVNQSFCLAMVSVCTIGNTF